jgi:hypothetical protein
VLAVHTSWTLVPDSEAITQPVQLPHPPASAPVQGDHEVSGDRIVAHPKRREPVGGVERTQGLTVPVALGLRLRSCEVKVQRCDAVLTTQGRQVDRFVLHTFGNCRPLS